MRNLAVLIVIGAAASTSLAYAKAVDRSPQARLARAIEGREAGEPVKCITQRDIRSSEIFDRLAILYETNDGVRYVNRPKSGLSSLRSGDVLVTDTRSPDLCSIDVVRLYDSASRMPSGVVGLGEFVPYRRTKKQD